MNRGANNSERSSRTGLVAHPFKSGAVARWGASGSRNGVAGRIEVMRSDREGAGVGGAYRTDDRPVFGRYPMRAIRQDGSHRGVMRW